jgi:glycosyltransferase involved in cell wall biosynthesis
VPDVRFTIVGRRPSARIRGLTAGNGAIRLVPDVPDVRPYLEAASVFVVPLRIGGGTRLKIFEAMAMELPVVSTSVGAEGLRVEPGVHLEVGDSVDDFAARVVRLLRDPTHARTLATRAAALVRRQHDWRVAGEAFTRLCEEVVEHRRSAHQPATGKLA